MTKIILGICIGIVLGGAGVWTAFQHHVVGREAEAKKEEHKEEPHVLHTNDQTWVRLDKEAQEHSGLVTAPLEAASLKPEIKVYGRVLDPAPLAAALSELAGARLALEASTKDFNRLKVLHGQDQNISTRTLESAEASVKRDQLLAQSAEVRLLTSWGKPIVAQTDLPAFVHALATHEAALIRVDVPLGEAIKQASPGARISSMSDPEHVVDAQFIGSAVSADPQTQGQGYLYLIRNSTWAPASAVVAWLSARNETEQGVVVPRAAVVRHEGEAFLYVQSSDELFERVEVELEVPMDKGWFINEKLKPGQKAVVVGAQQLLSEELKGQGEE